MENKRVLIITMHKVKNFGSALQAWALQESVRKLGYDVQLIDYKYPNDYFFKHNVKETTKKVPLLKKITIKRVLGRLKLMFLYQQKKQGELFSRFWSKYFSMTRAYNSPEEIQNDAPSADIYMTGSDQVWNPNTMYGDPAFFLNFGDPSIPRISYAASFGTNHIPVEYRKEYAESIFNYKYLSIRENKGIEIVKSLTGKDSTLVCDPTLLLSGKDYEVLATDSTIRIDKPYLLAYILDYAYNPRPAIDHIIQQVSKKLGLYVVYLVCGNTNGYKWGSTTISAAGPNEFARLFRDASFVVTSSFHGTVFSLINEKPFYAVTSASKSDSRISSLLNEVGLNARGIPACQILDPETLDLKVDYSVVLPNIERLRLNSLNFLQKSLKACDTIKE